VAEADDVTIAIFNLYLPRVIKSVLRPSNDLGTFGPNFLEESGQIVYPDVSIPRRICMDISI